MVTVETKPRTFSYRTTTEWLGRRNARLGSSGKDPIPLSAPAEFRGDGHLLNPEELFVGSIESCLMMTFVSLAEKHHLPIEAYYSEATGDLEYAEGDFRFTHVVVKPTVVISSFDAAPKALQLLKSAEHCLITNSVRCEVRVEPDVELSVSE